DGIRDFHVTGVQTCALPIYIPGPAGQPAPFSSARTMGPMPIHSGPVAAVVLLLLLAGVQKLIDPSPTAGALRSAGFPSHRNLVRLLAAVEVIVGGSFFVAGGPWPVLGAAVLYLGFAGFVALALTRNLPVSSCGCLGKVDTPPSVVHVAVNLG